MRMRTRGPTGQMRCRAYGMQSSLGQCCLSCRPQAKTASLCVLLVQGERCITPCISRPAVPGARDTACQRRRTRSGSSIFCCRDGTSVCAALRTPMSCRNTRIHLRAGFPSRGLSVQQGLDTARPAFVTGKLEKPPSFDAVPRLVGSCSATGGYVLRTVNSVYAYCLRRTLR